MQAVWLKGVHPCQPPFEPIMVDAVSLTRILLLMHSLSVCGTGSGANGTAQDCGSAPPQSVSGATDQSAPGSTAKPALPLKEKGPTIAPAPPATTPKQPKDLANPKTPFTRTKTEARGE